MHRVFRQYQSIVRQRGCAKCCIQKFDFYDKMGCSGGTYQGIYVAQESEWDFSKRLPDAIVINLGTNDNSYVKNDAAKKEEYTAAYLKGL